MEQHQQYIQLPAGRPSMSDIPQGVGILYVAHASAGAPRKYGEYDALGFWFTSSVSSQAQPHVLFFDQTRNRLGAFGPTLAGVLADPAVSSVRVLRLRDRDNEELFRSFVYAALTRAASEEAVLRAWIEKIVLVSDCPLEDSLAVMTTLHAPQQLEAGAPEYHNLEAIDRQLSKIREMSDLADQPEDDASLLEKIEACAFEDVGVFSGAGGPGPVAAPACGKRSKMVPGGAFQ